MEHLKSKHVLVTGGAGFIGSNIIEALLKAGVRTTCLDNFATGKPENIQPFKAYSHFTMIEGDIRDIDTCMKACEDTDIVCHQAALGSVPRSINDPKTSTDVNIGGFVNMLVAAKDTNIKRFVYAASSSTYGDNTELPKREDRIGKPLSPYGITKYVDEVFARNFAELYGLEPIGLRYFNVFGRRQDPDGAYAAVIPKFLRLLMRHEAPVINGDGKQSRDFTYIDNVVQANILAATTENPEATNQVYNVACGSNISLNALTQELINSLSQKDPAIADITPEHGTERRGDIRDSLASIEKAKKLLGYQPKYNVHQGLSEAIDWYYKHLK